VIDDERRNLNEHGRKHKSMIETKLTIEEKQEHKNTNIHGVMEKWKEMGMKEMLMRWKRFGHATWSVVFLQGK